MVWELWWLPWTPSFKRGGDAGPSRSDRNGDSRVAPLRLRIVARRPRGGRRPRSGYPCTRAFPLESAAKPREFTGLALHDPLQPVFVRPASRAAARSRTTPLTEETELRGIDGGQHSVLEHRDLLRAFAALPEEQRAVLLLIGVEDLSYQEAARVLGVPIGTVMSRLWRGRERLRRYMHGDMSGDNSRHSAPLRRVK